MRNFLFFLTLSSAIYGNTEGLTFLPKKAGTNVVLNTSDAICIYLEGGYRPVTKSAVDAVRASGGKTCNDKAEAILFAKTKALFVRHNKKSLGEGRYEEIKKAYYLHLSK